MRLIAYVDLPLRVHRARRLRAVAAVAGRCGAVHGQPRHLHCRAVPGGGFLTSRRGSRLIADYGGVQKVAPVLSAVFLISGLATVSLPGLAPFVSEFLVMVGSFGRYPAAAVVATVALVGSAIYILWTYQRMMGGPVTDGVRASPTSVVGERLVLFPLLAALLILGWPRPAGRDQPGGQSHHLGVGHAAARPTALGADA